VTPTSQSFLADETGTTNIEYGLIGSLFAIVCIAAWRLVGTALNGQYTKIATTVGGAVGN
jgi:Flp pilus assembly pilin Flp